MSIDFNRKEISLPEGNEISKAGKKKIIDASTAQELKNADQSTKKIISEYCEKMDTNITLRPMETLFSQNWKRIKLEKDINANLKECNPNYSLGKEWRTNCQRCVPTYEMRSRGYDVTSLPKPANPERSDLSFVPFNVWQNPEIIKCSKNGIEDIEKKMQEWGDGARAQVVVVWKNTNAGHTFVAERVNGKTIYVDPQNGNNNVKNYFSRVEDGTVRISRIDNLDVTSRILDCCRKV